MTMMNVALMRQFTHWFVGSEREVRRMVEQLWTCGGIFAVLPAEESGELVLCTNQTGWDLLGEYGLIGVVLPRET